MNRLNFLISACWGLVRYGLTGAASLIAYVGLSNALYYAGLHPTACTVIAWTVAALIAYFGHIHFSYRVQADHRRMLVRFVILLGINFLQTTGLTYLLYDVLKVSYSATSFIVGASSPLVSYPLNKYWVFSAKNKQSS